MVCVIIAAGPSVDFDRLGTIGQNREAFFILCADGGFYHAKAANLLPDLLVGDLDSLAEIDLPSGVDTRRLNPQKDVTDSRECIRIGVSMGFRTFELHGMLGGRIDHALSNLSDLYYINNLGAGARMYDALCTVELVAGITVVEGAAGETISFMLYGPAPKSITLKGFLYPLDAYEGDISFQIGVSNQLVGTRGEVIVHGGCLLMIRNKQG